MRKKAAARFCRACGYEFARDDSDECRMCARFEQLRIESAVPRPSELGSRQTLPEEPLDIGDPVPSVERPTTPSEYRAVLAARRARTPSADGQSRGPAATVIGTPALPRPANSPMEAPTAALAGESAPPRKKKPTARRKSRPTPTPTPPPGGPTPILIRLRVPPLQPANVSMEAPAPTVLRESPSPEEKSPARRESRYMPPPTREDAPSFSAAAKENTALAARDAHPVTRSRAVGHDAAFSHQRYPWKAAFWVAVGGALIGASVPLLSSFIR